MRAVVYSSLGGPEVLRLIDRPAPFPGRGEVLVRIAFSGVNPTDWKARRGSGQPGGRPPFAEQVPNQDGSGTVVATGDGVDPARVGERVWVWEAAWQRSEGTAQELVALPADQAVPLPEGAALELGASIGIPAITAHRCLTAFEQGPRNLSPAALQGRTVLVAGGAGAVGHAAVELASWSGARVIATVSSAEKARLARAAGADEVVDYRHQDAAATIRELSPDGVDLVVEVAPSANAELDQAVLAEGGLVVAYASDQELVSLRIRPAMVANTRHLFILVYTLPRDLKSTAVADVGRALEAGALRVGEEAGLPLHLFPLERAADAHRAVEEATVGKVLIQL